MTEHSENCEIPTTSGDVLIAPGQGSSIVIPLPLLITYNVIGSTGILGNLITVLIISLTMDIKKTLTNMLILNQSIIDFFCSVFLVLTTVASNPDRHIETFADVVYCKVWLTKMPLWGCFASSSFGLITITLERFVAIKFPIWYKTSMTRTKLVLATGLLGLLGLVVMLCYVAAATTIVDGHCNVYVANAELGYMVVVLQFFLPIFVFIVVYSQIVFALKNRVGPGSKDRNESKFQEKISRNIIVTLVKVVVCFVVCWAPNQFYFFLYLLGLIQIDFEGVFYHFSVVLIFCNCCCNPIVYALSYKNFRAGAAKLFRLSRLQGQIVNSGNSSSLADNATTRD